MLTVLQLVRATDVKTMEKASSVHIKDLRSDGGKNIVKYVARTRSQDTDPSVFYTTDVEVHPDNLLKVGCSCNGFRFHYQEAMLKKDAVSTAYKTPADSRQVPMANATRTITPRIGLCAHLYAMVKYLVKKGNIQ